MIGRVERLSRRLAVLALAVSCEAAAAGKASLTVPIVISSSGLAGSFYTSELSLTNRGTTAVTVRFTYTAAFGGGGGTGTDTLAAGRQKTVPDAIAYLIAIGVPIPSSGNRGGVLRADFTGLSSVDAVAITARTTTAVSGGRAGLSYAAFGKGLGGASYLCGLRQDAADRSNVALLNAGVAAAGTIVLRVTAFSGDPRAPATRVLPDLTLAPGAFHQYTEILAGVGLDRGYVRIERVSGGAPYYAYATILDQITSDGSFVPPLGEDDIWTPGGLTLPVVVETPAFTTEVILCNVSPVTSTVRLSYVADAIQAADSTASVSITLAAGEQRIIPAFVELLRSQGVPGVGAPGATFAGALYLRVSGEDDGGIFLGGRTQTSAGAGRYGLFYTALASGTAPTSAAWLFGLQQDAENRTNLALVNTGETDATPLDLHVDLHDGATGSIARSLDVSLAPRRWTQVNTVLSPGLANGYARITRTSGTNPFLAYAVVVDGGAPQTRSDDGAFVALQVEEPPLSAELAAIRKVEARSRSLLAAGASPLEFALAVADFMSTLPEYAVTGADEPSLTAYGVFADGRVHLVTDNRLSDEVPQGLPGGQRLDRLVQAELPESGWARLLQSFGPNLREQAVVNDLATWLKSPGGYAIRIGMVGDARLTALRRVSGDGFFYLSTHGGMGYKTRDKSGPRFFSVQSSTLATPGSEHLGEIKTDMEAGRLTFITARNFQRVFDDDLGTMVHGVDTRYGITSEFVKRYWSFGSNSILVMGACLSGDTAGGAGAQEFIAQCWARGAGVYFGWDKSVSTLACDRAIRYFVDRLVGANRFLAENPDQRAFPWDLVYQDMTREGFAHDTSYGATLKPFPRPAGPATIILDPSIQELLVNEYDEKLELKGFFGSTKGKVLVDAGELPGCDWKPDSIICPLSSGGPSHGDVTVEVPGELGRVRKSNVRQLTEWVVPIDYLWTDAITIQGFRFAGTGTLRFRGDIGGYRRNPGDLPILPLRGMVPTKDSSLTVTGSGSNLSGSCTWTLSGSGVYESFTKGPGRPLQLLAAARVDVNTPHLGALGLAFGTVPGNPFVITLTGPECAGTFAALPWIGNLRGSHTFPGPVEGVPTPSMPGLPLTFDGAFRTPALKFLDLTFGGEISIGFQQALVPVPEVRLDLAR